MANADLEPRPPRTRDSLAVTLHDSPDYGKTSSPVPFMPWMQIADLWQIRRGGAPGQRMRIAFDYRNARLTISPDFE